MNESFDIFLSHDSADAELAGMITTRLETYGLSVYASAPLKKRDAAAESAIRRALTGSHAFVALMSRKTSHSAWVLFECGAASQNRMPIYLILKGLKANDVSPFFRKHARILTLRQLNSLADAVLPARVAI